VLKKNALSVVTSGIRR